MGRLRRPQSSLLELNPTLSDIFADGISTHRSCWLHMVSHHYRCNDYITWEEVVEIKKHYRRTAPCFSRSLYHREYLYQELSTSEISGGMDNNAVVTQREGCKLDTNTFACYMESLWKNFSEDKRESFAYIDSLWFSMYRDSTNTSTRQKVLTWIKRKDIFSKKYVFLPIVCWGHWNLLILVHFGENSDLESRTPCMLLLDSLESAEPKRLEPEIRKFVVDIYKAEGRTEDKKVISKIPLLVPKVPQQRDDEECGVFVLYFIDLFMKAAPENFSIPHGYPYFMLTDWFKPEDLDSFRQKLEKELPSKKREIKTTRISRRKTTRKGGVITVDD